MGFDYNFDRDEPRISVPAASKRRRWVFAAVFTVILVVLVLIFRPESATLEQETSIPGSEVQQGEQQIAQGKPGDAVQATSPLNFSDEQKAKFATAESALQKREFVKAKLVSESLLKEFTPYSAEWLSTAELLGRANTVIMMKKIPCAKNIIHVVKSGDTFKGIAKNYNDMSLFLLREINGRAENDDHLAVGEKLVIYNAEWRMEINKGAGILAVYDGSELFKIYPAGISEKNKVPAGEYIMPFSKKKKFPAGGDRNNPYGTRFMGFKNIDGGIHGSWESELKKPFKDGYIRLNNNDIEELFMYIPGGTKAKVLD